MRVVSELCHVRPETLVLRKNNMRRRPGVTRSRVQDDIRDAARPKLVSRPRGDGREVDARTVSVVSHLLTGPESRVPGPYAGALGCSDRSTHAGARGGVAH
jgi:hypothetical protein